MLTSLASSRQRGTALFVSLLFVAMTMGLVYAITQASADNRLKTTSHTEREEGIFAAQGMLDVVVSDIWGKYLDAYPSGDGGYIQTVLSAKYSWNTVAAGADPIADNFRQMDPASTVTRCDLTNFGDLRFGGYLPSQVRLYRRDRNDVVKAIFRTDLLVVVETQKDLGFESIEEQLTKLDLSERQTLAGANWVAGVYTFEPGTKAMDWAVLTQNLTCSMCHMKVQNLAKVMNTDPNMYNTFSRVKVGTTDFLGIRPSSANTNIEGTLYHRGRLESELDGVPLTPAQFCAATVSSKQFVSSTSTNIKQTSTGATITTPFVNATPDGAGNLPANQNLYLNLPVEQSKLKQSGDLPSTFPAPFPDLNRTADNNRPNHKVDSDEVDFLKNNSSGSISGYVKKVDVAAGEKYTSNTLPTSNTESIINGHKGTVVIHGTDSAPIVLNGRVVIEGDVMITGSVIGEGQIYATGNVYVPGDLKYKNVSGKFGTGKTASGETVNNLMGVVAGGNIIIGDYISAVTHWNSGKPEFYRLGVPEPGKRLVSKDSGAPDPSNPTNFRNPYTDLNGVPATGERYNMANFVMEQLAVFNRQEMLKTLPNLPKKPSSGTFDPANPANYVIANNTTNNTPNSVYDPTYIPRYYSFYKHDKAAPAENPIPLYLHAGTNWDASKKRWNGAGDPHGYGWIRTLNEIPATVQSSVVAVDKKHNVLNIHPEWMDTSTMMQLLSNIEAARPNEPRQLDGLLYTNNAIFAIERKTAQKYNSSSGTYSKVNSKSGGRMTVNGALVAPDMGILVTQGSGGNSFTVNYDSRVMDTLPLEAPATSFSITRQAYVKNFGALQTP